MSRERCHTSPRSDSLDGLQVGAELAISGSSADAAARSKVLPELLGHYTRVMTQPRTEFEDVAVAVQGHQRSGTPHSPPPRRTRQLHLSCQPPL